MFPAQLNQRERERGKSDVAHVRCIKQAQFVQSKTASYFLHTIIKLLYRGKNIYQRCGRIFSYIIIINSIQCSMLLRVLSPFLLTILLPAPLAALPLVSGGPLAFAFVRDGGCTRIRSFACSPCSCACKVASILEGNALEVAAISVRSFFVLFLFAGAVAAMVGLLLLLLLLPLL